MINKTEQKKNKRNDQQARYKESIRSFSKSENLTREKFLDSQSIDKKEAKLKVLSILRI